MNNSKLKNMLFSVLVLCILAGSSGLLLGVVNKITYIDPYAESYKKFAKLANTFEKFEMQAENDGDILLFAKTEGENAFYAFTVKANSNYGGPLTMYIIIKDSSIIKIEQGETNDTYFGRVEPIYSQYYNADINSNFGANDGYLVSGATGTSTAVRDAVISATNYYKNYIGQGE